MYIHGQITEIVLNNLLHGIISFVMQVFTACQTNLSYIIAKTQQHAKLFYK